MTDDEAVREARSKLSQSAEKIISLPPEAYLATPAAEVQGIVRDLIKETRDLRTKVEQLEQAQSELAKARQRASDLFEFAPAGYFVLNSRGAISSVNITVCDMLGISKGEMMGAPLSNLIEPEYNEALRCYLNDLAATGQRLRLEIQMRRRDGSTFYAQLQTVPQYENSEITYRVSLTDITERKRAETALKETEEKYHDLAELLPEIVFETDAHGRLAYANARATALLGLTADDVTNGFSIFELIEPDQRDAAAERFRQIIQGGEVGPNEYSLIGRNGITFPAIVHSSKIETEGKVRGIRGIAIDVTERKKAELALQESEDRLRTTLDAMLEGCIILDFHWRYLYFNKASVRLGRRPKEDPTGRTLMEVYPGIENQETFVRLKRCLEDRVPEYYETEFTFPEGNRGWFEVRAEPVPQGMLILYTDISERKVADRRLKEGVERLERIYGITQMATMKPVGLLMIEHRLIEQVIALLVREKAKLATTDTFNQRFVEYVVDFFRTYADKTHHGKEENVLFKVLSAKPLTPEHRHTMDELVREHIQGRQLVTDLIAAKERWAADESGARAGLIAAIDGLVELYPRHIETEDKLFFPPAMAYCTSQEMNDMLLEFWEYDRQMIHRRYAEGLETLTMIQKETPPLS